MDDPTINRNIDQLISDMLTYRGGTTSDTFQRPIMARIHAIVAKEQSDAAAKLEKQTSTLIRLTWGLFWLTLALTFVAAVQLYIMFK
jgi:hypothetical protein